MPYIKKQDRTVYVSTIENVLHGIPPGSPMEQADYIGYFTFGLITGFYNMERYHPDANPFAYPCKEGDAKKLLDEQISLILEVLHTKDIMARGGELNYVVSAVVWGFLGDSANFDPAKYATRAYMHGVLLRIKDFVEQYHPYGNEERQFYTLLRGVMGDIMDELYRRRTAVYENSKIEENGDVWPLRVEMVNVEPE